MSGEAGEPFDDDEDERKPVVDNRPVETVDLDELAHQLRQVEGVDHATSDSAGAANWLGVRLDAYWDDEGVNEGYNIPDAVLQKTTANRWTLTDITPEWVARADWYYPQLHFRPVEYVVGLGDGQ